MLSGHMSNNMAMIEHYAVTVQNSSLITSAYQPTSYRPLSRIGFSSWHRIGIGQTRRTTDGHFGACQEL